MSARTILSLPSFVLILRILSPCASKTLATRLLARLTRQRSSAAHRAYL